MSWPTWLAVGLASWFAVALLIGMAVGHAVNPNGKD